MSRDIFPKSQIPVRKVKDLLPQIFKTESNNKFLEGVVDPLVQPGLLEKTVGYVGRRYGKTYKSSDTYLDTDNTLRSRYQLEPAVIVRNDISIENYYDYLDFKNQLKFFGNTEDRDDLITSQDHYTWNPPIDWDKFVNYREYFWVPAGPPAVKVLGQAQGITSRYRVTSSASQSAYIFSPDGLTNNPTLTLYRGQTYKLQINTPGNKLAIRSNIDTGSLVYNPLLGYSKGQIVLYDNNLWQATEAVAIAGQDVPLDTSSGIWNQLETLEEQQTAFDYDIGVTNNRIENGTITFTVPFDAPDVLFYQSVTDPSRFGKFIISDIGSNTKLNVETDILGKSDYLSSNGVPFTNGLIVRFEGNVTPVKYASDTWLVEGVGEKITLTRFYDLTVSPRLTTSAPEILFDDAGFDSQPFDDASAYPVSKDYITIAKSSSDSNPWSRYNRWFHRSVLNYAHEFNNSSFDSSEDARAKRPIIEFKPNLQLFNHGGISKTQVDYVDNFTTDVFSTIEGSLGYNIDNEELFNGARILITADTDRLVNNRIYKVTFLKHNGRNQISLIPADDADSVTGNCVLVTRGSQNKGLMYHFDGDQWIKSQEKTTVNQAPLFDIFDDNEVSFGNTDTYPVTTFTGSKIISYKVGVGAVDAELGFQLSYLNIDNVGDIQFNFDIEQETFKYQINRVNYSGKISNGFYKFNIENTYSNGWIGLNSEYLQPIIDSVTATASTDIVTNAVDWKKVTESMIRKIVVYVNGVRFGGAYTRTDNKFVFEKAFVAGDVITFKLFIDIDPLEGYYEIPLGLERNPLNSDISTFTLGQASDHVLSALDLVDGFSGNYPGDNNLRDLSDYQQLSRRFVKHSGLAPLAIQLLCDKEINIIKSLQYSRKAYTDFKNNFIAIAEKLYYDQEPGNYVDSVLEEMSRTQNVMNAFANSDMVGNGAFTAINYEVEDEGIKTFALSSKFDLDTLSNKAVYVYLNGEQLLHGRDYTFNSTFGFVNLNLTLVENDQIEIREYVSTGSNFIPPTPTKLGLYKKYLPQKFIDDTYVVPKEVIQGHDGSITVAYGDYRDDVLLELEYRIYNNIKQQYDESIFDIDAVIGGFYGTGIYSKKQVDNIVSREFLTWISGTNIDYVNNIYLDSENSFTYTYSNMTDPSGTTNLPGWWRGVYQYFYDTDRPHRCPWEMLGFSEKPTWWDEQYGSAPYTRNNLLLWEDLKDGIIRQGHRAGTHPRYVRPTLLSHIPVDGDGNLLSPLDSGLAGNFAYINNKGRFFVGDVSPAEYAWRSSSEWPFAIITALTLLRPFEFITDNFVKSAVVQNKLGQTVNNSSMLFSKVDDLLTSGFDHLTSSGLCVYVLNYLKSRSVPTSLLSTKFENIDVKLSHRMSGFVDQQQQKFILDSKSPKSQSSSIFIPVENYDIIFNISSPISSISYSGVIIEKVSGGFKVSGYDALNPFFEYFEPINSQVDPLITVGGVSENFLEWVSDRFYGNGVVVRYGSEFYRNLKSHTSGDAFEPSNWKQLPAIPVVGAVEAFKRRTFNTLRTKTLIYGEILPSVQSVVNFFLGYEEFLKKQGITFNSFDTTTLTTRDWFTSAKEFMFWTKHNWSEGSLITFSPAANLLEFKLSIGVADNLLDSFYGYQIFKNDGLPLKPEFINVNREFQKISISTTNTNDGIYYFKAHLVLKEHIAVFDDRTVFNDVLYDKPTGYRQDRVKARGFRTVDWDGDYTSPGFIFDSVNIQIWQPFTDYKLGDIVGYKSYYWTSQFNQLGSETFNDAAWTKLDSVPEKGLVSNFDYKINQFEDYYEVDADGVSSSQRDLARHLIGYQPREYLQQLAEDQVSQFKLYQGFIREKGSANAITKVFDKLSKTEEDSIVLNEEWAFQTGVFGGVDRSSIYEFTIKKDNFKINPQPMLITTSVQNSPITDQFMRIPASDFTLAPIPFTTSINVLSDFIEQTRSAGYVNVNDVDIILKSRDDLLNYNINAVAENSQIWITFDKNSWTVLRYNEPVSLRIESVSIIDETLKTARLHLTTTHNIVTDDYVGIKGVAALNGFFKVVNADRAFVDVTYTGNDKPELVDSFLATLGVFTKSRISDYNIDDAESIALLKPGSKLWIDNDGSGQWKVVKKAKQYTDIGLVNYGVSEPIKLGSAVKYIENRKQVVASLTASGYVMVYTDNTEALRLRQIISPPSGFEIPLTGVFGEVLSASPDYKFLVIGSPLASGVPSKYLGDLDATITYLEGDVVLNNGKLWKAINDIPTGDGSSINFENGDWVPATLVEANSLGRSHGYFEQGMISVYQFVDDRWENTVNILSPNQAHGEKFGSKISMGVSGTRYYMAVSATGALDNKGRVYLYEYTGSEWKHLENENYAGVYSNSTLVKYPTGTIVYDEGSLYESTTNNTGGSTSPSNSVSGWTKLDPISTQVSLPTSISLEDDDGSTLPTGMFTIDQLAETVKVGDQFGFETAMSRDGTILAVGVPESDNQIFANYKGYWKPFNEYRAGDVVKFMSSYYRCYAFDSTSDSTNVSKGDTPTAGEPWTDITYLSTDLTITGKVYVYKRVGNLYSLKQIITATNLSTFNDLSVDEVLTMGNKFGYSIDIDPSGLIMAISAPEADIDSQTQGAVFVFKTNDTANPEYRLKQKLQSYEDYTNEYFGSSVKISSGTEKIVVGAKNSAYSLLTAFEVGTQFDKNKTTFSDNQGFPGQVYVFENKNSNYFLTEKLETEFSRNESFGSAIDCTRSVIVVGSPNYSINDSITGNIRLFRKDSTISSLTTLSEQKPLVNVDLLKNIELYDEKTKSRLKELDIVDHYKLKILSVAEQELSFKTLYDPAIYMIGSEDQTIDETQCWYEVNIGKLWWDLSTVKFNYYEQSDLSYRIGNWNTQTVGSSIDIYEWVESVLLPSEWSILADTAEGLAEGISGQPKFADDSVYNTKEIYNSSTGQLIGTKYYFWVKNKTTLPKFEFGRRTPASSVADIINNPIGTGIPFISIIDSDKFLAYNLASALPSDTATINIEWSKDLSRTNIIHREYQLLTENVADSLPSESLERKWIDSLVGFDEAGNTVPDISIPERQRYGLSFRPRQTLFVDRIKALQIAIDRINAVLVTRPMSDLINFGNLSSLDPLPSAKLNQYDFEVDDYVDLLQVGTVRVKQAILSPNIINGKIDTIDIVDPGFGYRTAPFIEIEGTGKLASADITIDSQGRVSSVTITNRGRKYTSATVKIRPFSVLVKTDSTAAGRWSIYSWDQQRKIFYRSKSQGYDTTRYWSYVDWYATGFSEDSRLVSEINNFYEEPNITVSTGDLIRIKEYTSGGWAILQRVDGGNIDGRYNLVGRENGTIQIKKTIYDNSSASIGFDNVGSYDTDLYDLQPATELRIILQAAKDDIFVDDLRVEWNKLFFSSIKYVYSEQEYVDWSFKTSFVNATHNVGNLLQKTTYTNDNIESFQTYIEEVKPFRTTIREYTSRYTNLENTSTAMTDFDLPAAYSTRDGQILPINSAYDRFDEYPWKSWSDNNGYSITSISVANVGANYREPPTVLIEGNGTGATAKAFIANQKVSGIQVLTAGSGYTSTPKITLVGGNGTSSNIATAVAVLGNPKVRTFNVGLKFDRISKTGLYENFTYNQTFTASGLTSSFDLNYPATRNKDRIVVNKNGQTVLSSEYTISLFEKYNGSYTVIKGRLTFNNSPANGDVIEITYDKNNVIFDSVNRIDRYYAPLPGMKGKEKSQLMTGIDFGGVQIQGTTFEVTGGWDALPWFTDNWDSVESTSDYYYIADGSTTYVMLPYVPESGRVLTIYLKRVNDTRSTRIDDLYFDSYDGSTVQPNGRTTPTENALIPTFVGDGSTKIIELQNQLTNDFYLQLNAGDTLIFRPIESDGSVTITDINLLDTRLGGGNFSATGATGSEVAPRTTDGAYSTATGFTPEEIVVDGDKFISPDQVPAPEENVPGQVLDSVSIKVFNLVKEGSIPLQTKVIVGDNSRVIYDIGSRIMESASLIVYVDKVKQLDTVDYVIDYKANQVVFNTAPGAGSVIELITVGIGGVGLLDYQEFVADGDTNLFLTNAPFSDTTSVFVTVDGLEATPGILNSTDEIDTPNKTMIQFGIPPSDGAVIKIVAFAFFDTSIFGTLPIIRINKQDFYYDGSSSTFDLENFVDLSRSSLQSSVLVEVNGQYLRGVDTTVVVYDGTNNEITVGLDPEEAIGAITSGDLKVYINNVLQRFVIDYVYNGNANVVIIPAGNLVDGDVIKIENSFGSLYSINNNVLTINSGVLSTLQNNDDSTLKDVISVTWFSEYPTLDLISDEYAGGKIQYKLARSPISIEYVWVYKNGNRLTQDRDYTVSIQNETLYLVENSTTDDEIKVIVFGNSIYHPPAAFEIYKDMLNNVHYKRYSKDTRIRLVNDLTYYATEIEVTDGSLLSSPIPARRVPGVVIINNERIEYFVKTGNILSQLRRGSLGTAIAEVHASNSFVIDCGASETIPYTETQDRVDLEVSNYLTLISDGTTKAFEFTYTTEVDVGLGDKNNVVVKINTLDSNGQLVFVRTASRSEYTLSINSSLRIGTVTFNETVDILDTYVITLTSLICGPLDFIPSKSSRDFYRITEKVTTTVNDVSIVSIGYPSIPSSYGACDTVEVFAAGTRLRKNSISLYDETVGLTSPEADVTLEAEFSVDGAIPYVRLTEILDPGTRITVIRKQGKLWYDRGTNTATTGVTLLENNTAIAKFISIKSTELPE